MKIEEIAQGGANVPVTRLNSVDDFSPSAKEGAKRFEAPLGRDVDLEALLVQQGSDVLIVGFHGALTRENTVLPRFERLASFTKTDYNIMLFSDPTLRLGDDLQLSWYTGWAGVDVRKHIADWSMKAAQAVGAKHIVFFGGSGGGFAALQASAMVPGSYCVTLNPQTLISQYLVEGKLMGPQRRYVRYVWPELLPVPIEQLTMEHDWSTGAGEVVSAVKTFSRTIDSNVLFVQNINDFSHMESHYQPFRDQVANNENHQRVKFEFYEGPHAHVAPSQEIVDKAVTAIVSWARTGEYNRAFSDIDSKR